MNPFRNILRLSVGDFVAKALNFVAFVYLARTLGVGVYGVLEFSISILTYLLLLGDGGLDLWSTREAARGRDLVELVSRVVPVRLILTCVAVAGLLAVLPALPDYPHLRVLLAVFSAALFAQAGNLKWVFMGKERMGRVAAGLILGQIAFALAVFALVRRPEHVVWVAVVRLASELAMSGYFWWLFAKSFGRWRVPFTLRGTGRMLRPAFVLGATQALALMSFNFDTVLLGFLIGPTAVAFYSAGYKPVTVVLAMPITYFQGLFPSLSRTHSRTPEQFGRIVTESFRLMAVYGLTAGVCGTFLAEGVIGFLFGGDYSRSVPVFRVLIWSAVLVIARGTFRQGLNAVGRQDVDFRCAVLATSLNVVLNLVLIPLYGVIGAAWATLASEVVWFGAATYSFGRFVEPVRVLSVARVPLGAAVLGGVGFVAAGSLGGPVQAAVSLLLYAGVLLLCGEVGFVLRTLTHKA